MLASAILEIQDDRAAFFWKVELFKPLMAVQVGLCKEHAPTIEATCRTVKTPNILSEGTSAAACAPLEPLASLP